MTQIDGRYVHGETHYLGDVAETFDFSRAYGPNTLGELLYPLSAEFNHKTQMTTVWWSLTPPQEPA